MFGGVPGKPTGLAMSVLRRAEAFSKMGITSQILVDHFYSDYDAQVTELKARGMIGDSISVRYMYQDLAGDEAYGDEVEYVSPLGAGSEWRYEALRGNSDVVFGWYRGEYKERVLLREERVLFIDHMVDGKCVRRVWHDIAGRACKIEFMNANQKCSITQFLSKNGNCYLETSHDTATKRILRCEVYPRTSRSFECQGMVDVFLFWMQTLVLPRGEGPTIISEYGVRRSALNVLETENDARVIYTLHSNHLSAPHRYGSGIRPEMNDLISHIRECQDVVVLTAEQQQDLWKQYGWMKSLHLIPHYVPEPPAEGDRDLKKVVMVGRFEKIKGQLAAIRAFKDVLLQVPDARLVFYGRGPSEVEMRELIDSLELTHAVSIAGFTSNPSEVFSQSAMSIVASDYEGFCLSLIESMAAGCVPVSYDIKYGPREMIDNGVNGFLIEQGNEIELSASLVLGLSCPSKLRELSDKAKLIQSKFSEEKFMKDWDAVLNRV